MTAYICVFIYFVRWLFSGKSAWGRGAGAGETRGLNVFGKEIKTTRNQKHSSDLDSFRT